MPDELKRCPFCGEKAEIYDTGYGFHVICNYKGKGCGAFGPHRIFENEAIEAWQARQEECDRMREERDRYKVALHEVDEEAENLRDLYPDIWPLPEAPEGGEE